MSPSKYAMHAEPEEMAAIAQLLTRFCMGVNITINGATTYDILLLMLREGLTMDNAIEWGARIGQTAFSAQSKDKH